MTENNEILEKAAAAGTIASGGIGGVVLQQLEFLTILTQLVI
jgi:hypothetical protein